MEEISDDLNAQETQFVRKKKARWCRTSIRYVLSNEKYIGDSLLQKTYTPNEFPLVNVRNNGQLSKFYIKNSHPAIIPVEVFETVQDLIESRAVFHQTTSVAGSFPLSGVLKCSICGSTFHRHLKKDIARWNCSQHAKNASLCPMKAVTEKEVYHIFLSVYNKLLDNQDILKTMLNQLTELQTKTAFAKPDIIAVNEKISELVKQNHSLTRLQTKGCIDSAIFIMRRPKMCRFLSRSAFLT